jgi:hypothetical protein
MLSMLNCQKSFKLTGSLLYLTVIKISEINVWENRSGNQEWTIQRHWQHWAHKIQDEDKQIKKHNTENLIFFVVFVTGLWSLTNKYHALVRVKDNLTMFLLSNSLLFAVVGGPLALQSNIFIPLYSLFHVAV